jgi:hypothetical protein
MVAFFDIEYSRADENLFGSSRAGRDSSVLKRR